MDWMVGSEVMKIQDIGSNSPQSELRVVYFYYVVVNPTWNLHHLWNEAQIKCEADEKSRFWLIRPVLIFPPPCESFSSQ